MTVKQLIAKLQKCPPNDEVVVCVPHCAYAEIKHVRVDCKEDPSRKENQVTMLIPDTESDLVRALEDAT
ncbi:MAG: hypothetical protein A2Y38_17050 [Spirochaetes bacterium GWB1_59_5]|nr:MAG: hypothetical protein A2Y38_17050 [Spirochaetes bacterium GWB1_59_5]